MTPAPAPRFRLIDTIPGRIAKTVLLAMFSTPAALSTLDRLDERLQFNAWMEWILLNFRAATVAFWSWVIPFGVDLSDRVSGVLTVSFILLIPCVFVEARARFMKTSVEASWTDQDDTERTVYLVISCLALIYILWSFSLLSSVLTSPFAAVALVSMALLHSIAEMVIGLAVIFVLLILLGAILSVMSAHWSAAIATVCVIGLGVYFTVSNWAAISGIFDWRPVGEWYQSYSEWTMRTLWQILLALPIIVLFVVNAALRRYTPMYIVLAILGIHLINAIPSAWLPPPPPAPA